MVDEFDLNKRTGIDLPNEVVSWTPSREFKRRMQPRDPEWRDIDTVYASFGQVYDIITPISLIRTHCGDQRGWQDVHSSPVERSEADRHSRHAGLSWSSDVPAARSITT